MREVIFHALQDGDADILVQPPPTATVKEDIEPAAQMLYAFDGY